MMAAELLAHFVRDTHRLLAHVDESYCMADGLTLDVYLTLSDAERDALEPSINNSLNFVLFSA